MFVDLAALAGLLYLISMVLYSAYLFFRYRQIGVAATIACILGLCFHLATFGFRWREFFVMNGGGFLKSVPITNLYESLQFFALLMIIGYLIFEFSSKTRVAGAFATAVAGATVLFIDAIGASGTMAPLVPALQSNWLLAHVSLSFVAYMFFALSAISAFLYLILTADNKNNPYFIFWSIVTGIATSGLLALIFDGVIAYFNGDMAHFRLFSATLNNQLTVVKLMFAFLTVLMIIFFWHWGLIIKRVFITFHIDPVKLDNLTYKFAILGFVIFTVGGLIFGAIWAEQAWGRYWSWDPKETWAFITWVVYGVYLHGRITNRWTQKLANTLSIIGFMLTIFTYLGVNLLLSGLHSYGGL